MLYTIKSVSYVLAGAIVASFIFSTAANAQEEESSQRGATSALFEEIIVSATKRDELAQDVPLSISAFKSDQIEALKIRDLTNLAVSMPNVALDDIGTARGTANFSIRGLGVNSSIPSIDPTVGIFVDGVYLGLNAGVLFDTFDLESIEVLRGPQGILFGRNVTGGAILLNTKKPGNEFEASIRGSIEGGGEGLNTYLMGSISGPISDNFGAKLTVYTNQDDGWFKNLATGGEHGEANTVMIRPSFVWTPSDSVEITVRYEYQETDGDGPASQSHTNGSGVPNFFSNFDRDSHDFAIDEPGFQETETNFFVAQVDWDVDFGEGTITNILGWRDYDSLGLSDIDASAASLFHATFGTKAEQFSNELRYTGVFNDNVILTTGVYYFTNEINYSEGRLLLGIATPDGSPALTQHGGGDYEVDTLGIFVSVDFDMTDDLTLTAGLRYTDEEKSANIASLVFNVNAPCDVIAGTCPIDFTDTETYSNVSPKVGFTYHVSDDSRIYGHWTRGFRSGGYNLRNTAVDTVNLGPGPFLEEQVDNFEFGYKSTYDWGRLNAAVFYNEIADMQREINLSDPIAGVVQVIRNTADAEIFGFEVDGLFALGDNTALTASLGYINPEYSAVQFDLNGDGVLNAADEALDLPRAAELTYAIGLTHDKELGNWGYMTSRISFAHRDESAYTDNNLGFITEQDMLDAGVDFYSNEGDWAIGIYGKNLLDEVKHGGDTQLPAMLGPVPLGGTFSPLAKGLVYGVEVTYGF